MASVSFLRADGVSVPAYLFGSKQKASYAIVVLQEWWGINDEIKQVAETISKHNDDCLTIIPDFYRGKLGLNAEEAHHLMGNLDWAKAIDDMRATSQYLRETHGATKVGSVGFCMGGALALASVALAPELYDCAITFYGIPSTQLVADPSKITRPVQGHFGDLDTHTGFSDKEAAAKLKSQLEAGGVPHELYSYPTQGHGFMNPPTEFGNRTRELMGRPKYDPEPITQAYERVRKFFNQYLA